MGILWDERAVQSVPAVPGSLYFEAEPLAWLRALFLLLWLKDLPGRLPRGPLFVWLQRRA